MRVDSTPLHPPCESVQSARSGGSRGRTGVPIAYGRVAYLPGVARSVMGGDIMPPSLPPVSAPNALGHLHYPVGLHVAHMMAGMRRGPLPCLRTTARSPQDRRLESSNSCSHQRRGNPFGRHSLPANPHPPPRHAAWPRRRGHTPTHLPCGASSRELHVELTCVLIIHTKG